MSRALFVDFDGELHATHDRAEAMLEFDWFPILLRLLEPHQGKRPANPLLSQTGQAARMVSI